MRRGSGEAARGRVGEGSAAESAVLAGGEVLLVNVHAILTTRSPAIASRATQEVFEITDPELAETCPT
jgi:hypothetical protein